MAWMIRDKQLVNIRSQVRKELDSVLLEIQDKFNSENRYYNKKYKEITKKYGPAGTASPWYSNTAQMEMRGPTQAQEKIHEVQSMVREARSKFLKEKLKEKFTELAKRYGRD